MADSITSIHLIERGVDPATLANLFLRSTQGSREALRKLVDRLESASSGVIHGKVTIRVDSSTAAAAAGTITCVQADGTAGDVLGISFPGLGVAYKLTAVASGPVAASGEYSLETDDTAVGVSLAAAINAVPGLKDLVTATESTGTVTVTAKQPGSWWNGTYLTKVLTTASAHVLTQPTGGADVGDQPDMTVTFGTPNIANDDTIRIGSVLFTWKASASTENEITSSATEATAAANFLAKVNAHSALRGLVLASADSAAVVRLTWLGAPRDGELVYVARAETNSGSVVLSAAAFASGATEAYAAAPRSLPLGAA